MLWQRFDKTGRRIPQLVEADTRGLYDEDKRFVQPRMETLQDYADRLSRLNSSLGIDTGITPDKFKQEIESQLALIRGDSKISNIMRRVWLPIVIPKIEKEDIGAIMNVFLEAVRKSFDDAFAGKIEYLYPERKFYNYRNEGLAGKISIVEGSRQDELVKRTKEGPVVAIFFPESLRGFSVDASREQMATLPENFVLSGLDAIIAEAMYPDILAEGYVPGIDVAALYLGSADNSFYFHSDREGFLFSDNSRYNIPRISFSAGLLFLPGISAKT